ncbi:uncharacterized protein TRIVIDRAFT_60091 [Trichoderma virens Gv29-8]|uniref:Uncharacterized protein n=1 Tax=Hypocrea virens (strain Gv29-8 / FGSC 10586) TaxID=413071 RepID=G9MT54_HYPVG|nr:uncharacterized protein TRIVIDRAFT_60091 [Trichoderma virens Gv29-8]EHK23096.1 hypothetical protein TRIVIDRAFT_60091 [Trichoderma virens Gv29-8]UKZ48156.1 hypothetical protein TrVGV298_002392 [Trichoderma virens]
MALVLPPSVDHFNSLPGIAESNESFQTHCTQKMLSDICAVFVKHKAQHIYGLALVHQHFDLETDEKLVNIGNVAVPLKTGSVSTTIAATRWAFSGESVIPYEFSTEARQIDMDQHHDFIYELGKLIHSCGLSDHLGLCSLDSIADTTKGPTMEFTSGRANITLPFDIDPENGQSVEAAWQDQSREWLDLPNASRAAKQVQILVISHITNIPEPSRLTDMVTYPIYQQQRARSRAIVYLCLD